LQKDACGPAGRVLAPWRLGVNQRALPGALHAKTQTAKDRKEETEYWWDWRSLMALV